jgi:hypothetical protein
MLFGGAFFDPSVRPARRTSLLGLMSNVGILLGGFVIFTSVFLPWVHGVLVGSAYTPPNAIAAEGALGWFLVALGGALILGAMANILGHSRRFNLGLQVFAIAAGIAALISHAFMRPCFAPPYEGRVLVGSLGFGPTCPWTGDGLGSGYYLVRAGAAITIASAALALAIAGIATTIRRRRTPVIA